MPRVTEEESKTSEGDLSQRTASASSGASSATAQVDNMEVLKRCFGQLIAGVRSVIGEADFSNLKDSYKALFLSESDPQSIAKSLRGEVGSSLDRGYVVAAKLEPLLLRFINDFPNTAHKSLEEKASIARYASVGLADKINEQILSRVKAELVDLVIDDLRIDDPVVDAIIRVDDAERKAHVSGEIKNLVILTILKEAVASVQRAKISEADLSQRTVPVSSDASRPVSVQVDGTTVLKRCLEELITGINEAVSQADLQDLRSVVSDLISERRSPLTIAKSLRDDIGLEPDRGYVKASDLEVLVLKFMMESPNAAHKSSDEKKLIAKEVAKILADRINEKILLFAKEKPRGFDPHNSDRQVYVSSKINKLVVMQILKGVIQKSAKGATLSQQRSTRERPKRERSERKKRGQRP